MPSIIINDRDTTTVSGTIDNNYAAFIPGLAMNLDAPTTATLFNSLETFRAAIGTSPVVYGPESNPDKSYIMACELLGAGLPIVYKVIPIEADLLEELTETNICDAIKALDISEIADRGAFDISFVTTGGYPTVYEFKADDESEPEIRDNIVKLTDVSSARGDAFAIIDLAEGMKVNVPEDVPEVVKGIQDNIAADALLVTPWINISPNYSNLFSTVTLPGSFAFLKAFANSIKTNNSWLATAGVKRGSVSASGVTNIVTNAEADALQPAQAQAVNAITYIKPYGYTIWGNRTLVSNAAGLVANSFVNIRQLVHDIKRNLYKVARGLMFDPNDEILWTNFRAQVTPLLERMQSGQGISSYRLVRQRTTARATLVAKIIIAPIEAVENFELTVVLTDEDTTVTG